MNYSRAEAIEDGVLVSLAHNPELAQLCVEAGFRAPIAVTSEVFATCIELTPAAKRAGQDIKGRLWDVLSMLRFRFRMGRAPIVLFDVLVVRDRVRPSRTRLKCVVGPGDHGEPVFTIMFPEQD